MKTISVIVASCGRPTLKATLASISPQLRPGDEILVDVNEDSPWGHGARNRRMPQARGDGLMFIDDDDVYLPAALEAARLALVQAPSRMHMFRMRYVDGRELWENKEVREGNVSTQMFVVPNLWETARVNDPSTIRFLPEWGARYAGDFDFIRGWCEKFGPPIWHQRTITLYGHSAQLELDAAPLTSWERHGDYDG